MLRQPVGTGTGLYRPAPTYEAPSCKLYWVILLSISHVARREGCRRPCPAGAPMGYHFTIILKPKKGRRKRWLRGERYRSVLGARYRPVQGGTGRYRAETLLRAGLFLGTITYVGAGCDPVRSYWIVKM
jgi:hypothetical protein